MTVHVGFTGTRRGMSDAQRAGVVDLLDDALRLDGFVAHHGDCVGGDEQFHSICRVPRGGPVVIVGHPPVDAKLRAFCDCDDLRSPLLYMQRNRAIVEASSVLIATPFEDEPQPSGGTWATIRMAWRARPPRGEERRRTFVVGRDGQLLDLAGKL